MKPYLIFFMIILAFACSKNRVPKGILSEEEITPVLVELHLAEAVYSQRYALEVSRDNYQEDLYLTILKKYKLDQKAFENSVLYYGKHPEQYKPIYDEVLNRLNEMSVKFRAKDSIQTLRLRESTKIKDSLLSKQLEAKSIVKDSVQHAKTDTSQSAKDQIQKIK